MESEGFTGRDSEKQMLNYFLTEQKARDDLQQQVIDQIGKQMDNLIPTLIQALNLKKESHE